MSKYKIKIIWDGMYYNQCLYKRVWWLFWKRIEQDHKFFAITEKVLGWQKKYNIPDKKVIIIQ